MHSRTYLALLQELETVSAPEEVKQQFAEMLRRHAAQEQVKSVERLARVELAQSLLSQGVDRAIIASRLMARFGIKRTAAYEDIGKAL